MKRSRFQNGLDAQNGACNVRAIARGLRDGVAEAKTEGVAPEECPGVRLMVHQLAWLCLSGSPPAVTERQAGVDAALFEQYVARRGDELEWAAQALVEAADHAASSGPPSEHPNVAFLVGVAQIHTIGEGSTTTWDGWEPAMDACKKRCDAYAEEDA